MRDPELLACIRGALDRREVCFGRASSLAPGRVFEINAAPLPSGGALAVLHDVTGIEAAQKSRREFVANVSHELRTPLTSIQGYVETLIEDPNPQPGNDARISWRDPEERDAHEPSDGGPACSGQRGKPRLQTLAAAASAPARW